MVKEKQGCKVRHSDDLVPLGHVESGLELLAEKTDDFSGKLELMAE